MLSSKVIDAWKIVPKSVRDALVALEESATTLTALESITSTSSSSGDDKAETVVEVSHKEGTKIVLKPLEGAPHNVYSISKTLTAHVDNKAGALVTHSRGWRNVFNLPIAYDVNIMPHGTLLDPVNRQLLESTGVHPEGYNRRFAVLDSAIETLYGPKIQEYFKLNGIDLTVCVLNGEEANKRSDAVDTVLDALCAYKLRRREPFLVIGGGVVLDIAGMAACLYRRGVPFVRVPTTLLAIVDASVGVKNGVDYCCSITGETYKNRVGSFYAPSSCLLDPAFISTQCDRNICNGCGEIIKLGLVRSIDLFELLETHGAALVKWKFAPESETLKEVGYRIISLSIQIMLEELGPNLWEKTLERCVDYGHTFSKLLEMVPSADIMHGEAVNIDGFFCCILSYQRGYISMDTVKRVFACMKSLNLPTHSPHLQTDLAWQSCIDAVEHRHGEQRIPLITDIGESICVSDITRDELDHALQLMKEFDH